MPQPLSAADALSPAWRYARQYLNTQPRIMTAIKICAVAVFAEMGGFNFNASVPGRTGPTPGFPFSGAVLFTILSLLFVLCLVFFYLGSRLQFVIFEMVLRRDSIVGPVWKRYGGGVPWRWIGLKLLAFLAFAAALTTVAIPFIFYFIAHAKHEEEVSASFVCAIIAAVVLGLVLLLAWVALYVLLNCLCVPVVAFESTTLGATLSRVWTLFRAQPGAMLLFVLLRCLVSMGCILAAELLLGIAALIVLIPFGIVGYIAWHMLYSGGLAAEIVLGTILALLGLTFLTAFILAALRVIGHVHVFLQAYTLFFLAGRYPPVDPYLTPFLPAQFVPPVWTPEIYLPPAPQA